MATKTVKTEASTSPELPVVVRPSLDVAIENLAHMQPRVENLVGRLRGWDTRTMTAERKLSFGVAIGDLVAAHTRLTGELTSLAAEGYVAKTTPKTRLRASLEPGTSVELRGDVLADFALLYGNERVADIRVSRVLENRVALVAVVEGREDISLGVLPLSQVTPK